ncbi:nuclear pore complex protein NUP160 [Neltuma alba]|uniref:nuclear pore complex protein NUP160 n=1 Tax=Neltuma alba TaxID=207710 RepID=UPI0010A45065|nr:nuclear pore complex protein NUP160-like [Prosopis alba]
MSRGKMVSLVQDMVIYELHGKRFLFVLHLDGSVRVWDLSCNSRVFSHTMGTTTMTGASFMKLWLGQPCLDSSTIPVAILCKQSLDESLEMISIHNIQYNFSDRIIFSLKSSRNISLEEGGCIDVKLTSNKIWILKDDELISRMFSANTDEEEEFSHVLQEEFVADQLFQGSDHLADEILQIAHSLFSSSKDDIVPFVSSIFLRRLLLPGVHHNAVMHATLVEYKKQLVESEFQALTSDGLKKEILSAIEHEVGTEKMSIFQCWKYFCTRYFHNWCKINASCGLFIDYSTDAVGLIRKSSVSLFRSLEDIADYRRKDRREIGEG